MRGSHRSFRIPENDDKIRQKKYCLMILMFLPVEVLSSPYQLERFILIVRQPKLSVRTDVKTRRNLA